MVRAQHQIIAWDVVPVWSAISHIPCTMIRGLAPALSYQENRETQHSPASSNHRALPAGSLMALTCCHPASHLFLNPHKLALFCFQ